MSRLLAPFFPHEGLVPSGCWRDPRPQNRLGTGSVWSEPCRADRVRVNGGRRATMVIRWYERRVLGRGSSETASSRVRQFERVSGRQENSHGLSTSTGNGPHALRDLGSWNIRI